jgi:hypothetical protein
VNMSPGGDAIPSGTRFVKGQEEEKAR